MRVCIQEGDLFRVFKGVDNVGIKINNDARVELTLTYYDEEEECIVVDGLQLVDISESN